MNCPGCDKPMIDGQALNGLLKCHWDCQEATRAKIGSTKADEIVQANIKKRLLQDGIDRDHRLFHQLGGR